jgi:hypothetical protein
MNIMKSEFGFQIAGDNYQHFIDIDPKTMEPIIGDLNDLDSVFTTKKITYRLTYPPRVCLSLSLRRSSLTLILSLPFLNKFIYQS